MREADRGSCEIAPSAWVGSEGLLQPPNSSAATDLDLVSPYCRAVGVTPSGKSEDGLGQSAAAAAAVSPNCNTAGVATSSTDKGAAAVLPYCNTVGVATGVTTSGNSEDGAAAVSRSPNCDAVGVTTSSTSDKGAAAAAVLRGVRLCSAG